MLNIYIYIYNNNFFYELSNSTPPPLPPSTSSHYYFFITLNLIKQSNFYVKMFFHGNHSYEYIVFPYNALDHKSMYIS